jgi:hypothetical protein
MPCRPATLGPAPHPAPRGLAAGVYPFAGREVARAFALLSTELSDCNDDLEGLSFTELANLREWTQKFNFKYPVVGRIAPAVAKMA